MAKPKKPEQKSASKNNTWEHVREIRREVAEDYGSYLSSLDAAWREMSTDYGEFLCRDRDEAFGNTPLEACLMLLRMGYYPPPEILVAVADCFDEYFVHCGEIELDRFFKDRKRGLGDFATQRAAEHDSREFALMCQINASRDEKDRKNMNDLAIEYLQRIRNFSKEASEAMADAFVRQHDRLREREKAKK